MSTIGSYPIPFSMEGKIVIGVTCEEFKYMVIITPDIDSVRLFEILEHSSLAETQWTINKKLKK